MNALTRVMLVDDHSLCRSGLTELLEHRGGLKVVGATGDPTKVSAMLREHQPDLLVLDLRLATTDGLSVLRQIRADGCDTPTVILTMSDSEDDMAAALRAGVRGYLLKDMEPEEVIDAITRAARGEMVVASAMTLKLAQILQSGPKGSVKGDLVALLTERERQVLEHVARGQSNKVIAQALDISHNTVKLHVRHIMDKLNLRSRVEAAVFAFEYRSSPDGVKAASDAAQKNRG
jgi:two-component system nitrate/nitrite response regulator NarL